MRRFFPSGRIIRVPLQQVQRALIRVFETWGQPEAIKVDNGRPCGDPASDLIPVMALWLIALGIEVIWNRPRQPTDNAKVERMQAVTANWAEPRQCADLTALEQQLEQAAVIQRSRYRVRRLGDQTRLEAYPGLLTPGRTYRPEAFDLERVLTVLAQGTWVRTVSKVGQLEFYRQRWHLGARYRRQRVEIRLDAAQQQWIVTGEQGQEIARFSATFLCEENIRNLSLYQ
jgi:hypothetical protein